MAHRCYNLFRCSLAIFGGAILALSLALLPSQQLGWPFFVLAFATITVASRFSVKIPKVSGEITIADTLIFLTLILYGAQAAIVVAALDGLGSSLHVSRKLRVVLFNMAQMTVSTFVTAAVLQTIFSTTRGLYKLEPVHLSFAATAVMAVVQYMTNSGLVAVYTALKNNTGIWQTWRTHYLWTSITYLTGASIATISAHFVGGLSIYSLVMVSPIVAIIYVTYQTYLKNLATSDHNAEQARRHIEELSQYIAEQQRIREQFGQVEKMSALGELASGVAHDFNNTLASILGRGELMLRKVTDPEIRRGLEIIVKSAADGADTVKRIQDFARQRRDHDFEAIAVDELLMDVHDITRPRWKDRAQASNVQINLRLQINTEAYVMGDPSELREVLVNMVFNAVDAMPEGGQLTLVANELHGSVEIAISDTGIGMSHEIRSRVFDPFFTTKGKAGMGLGLAVCYGIIQRHEGTISIDSQLGKGTTFRIALPVAALEQEVKPETENAPRLRLVPNCTRPTVLIVDDEAPVRELLTEVMETEGYDVVAAENGEQALNEFARRNFKAIFTDVGMPGMSGWEFARAVRERDSRVPIAVITGWGEVVGSDEQANAEVDWVVSKPFSVDRICEIALEIAERSGCAVSASPAVATGS